MSGGAPLGESATIRGPASQGYIGGYSFVQADPLSAPKKLFEAHPHFEAPGATIEILEQQSMSGK